MNEIKRQMEKLDERVTAAEHRVSAAEDRNIWLERAMAYLLRREATLVAKCDYLENSQRRNNIRTYGIKDSMRENNMPAFVIDFL